MSLPSGQITLNQIHTFIGGGSGTTTSLNDGDLRYLANKSSGAISMSDFHSLPLTLGKFNKEGYNAYYAVGEISEIVNMSANAQVLLYGTGEIYLQKITDATYNLETGTWWQSGRPAHTGYQIWCWCFNGSVSGSTQNAWISLSSYVWWKVTQPWNITGTTSAIIRLYIRHFSYSSNTISWADFYLTATILEFQCVIQ